MSAKSERQSGLEEPIKGFSLHWPGRLLFGAGCLNQLGTETAGWGERAFLVTTSDLSKLGVAGRARSLLEQAGITVTLYDEVKPDPTCLAVDAAAERARDADCDVIVAVGGGSALDFGKAVGVAVTHPGPIWDYVTYTGADARPVTPATLPVVAVPTTAGTGSEVSMGTVLDNPERHMKAALLSVHVFPRLALVDPELTYTMPRAVTLTTGFDALTHAVESYLNTSRSNPASEVFALDAARRVLRYLPQLAEAETTGDHDDDKIRHARTQMSWAATAAGIAMALSNVTVAHAMGLPLGSRLHIPHGLGLSRLLPVVMERSWRAQPARYAALARALGLPEETGSDGAQKAGGKIERQAVCLVNGIKDFIRRIGLEEMWQNPGIDNETLRVLTNDVFAYMGRPVSQHAPVFTPEEIYAMYAEALREA